MLENLRFPSVENSKALGEPRVLHESRRRSERQLWPVGGSGLL